MFKLLRYFSICSAAVMAIITVVMAVSYRHVEITQMIDVAEVQNLSLARAIANSMGDQITSYVARKQHVDGNDLRKAPETAQWRETFARIIKDLPVLKVKIYSPAAVTIFSSEPAQIGKGPSSEIPFRAAVESGKVHSKYDFRPSFEAFDGPVYKRYVVSSYVPVYDSSGKNGAVLELYTDVTTYADAIAEHIIGVVAVIALAFAALYSALYFIVRRADTILDRQYSDLATFNEKLEGRVAERTKAAEEAADKLKRANRELEAATQAKSLFLANMSHEIRTPMNGVFGMTDLLLRTELSTHQHRLVATISQSARSLLTVINDILDISRIEAGKLEVDRHEFDLRHCIEGAVELFVDQAARKGLALSLFVSSDAPAVVWGDKGRLRQICINLIGNAIKFTESGEVSVRITARQSRIGSANMEFEFRDTGMGIDPAVIDKLLTPFAQGDSSVSRRFGGTGLGLSISRHLVELMGGKLAISSAANRGTTIKFTLSVEIGDDRKATRLLGRELPAHTRVLVIDDRETNREILTSYLGAAGADVSAVDNAAAGFEQLIAAAEAGQPIAAAIIDVVMPRMNGVDLLKLIAADPRLADLKTVLVTSMSWSGDLAEVRRLGAHAMLTKPVREVDLITAVSRAIGLTQRNPMSTIRRAESYAATGVVINARVLLAEDNPVNIEVAREFLGLLGCRVTVAENGRRAVDVNAAEAFDVILMDCQMPEMDGMTATRHIRQREREMNAKRIPIIAVTANAYDEDREQCLAADMDDYLSKPFSEAQLVEVLRRWVPDSVVAPVAAPIETVETDVVAQSEAPAAAAVSVKKKGNVSGKKSNGKKSVKRKGAATRPSMPSPDKVVATESETASPIVRDIVPGPKSSRPALFERLMTAMLSHAPQAVAGLQEALDSANFVGLMMHAHSLKSSTGNLGEHEMAELCRRLEAAANGRDLDACQPLVIEIAARISVLVQSYKVALGAEAEQVA